MATLLDIARWLEIKDLVGMATKIGLRSPFSLRDLIEEVVEQAPKIDHVFVLMLENRSFDHMLGFAGLRGQDAKTGQPTTAIDLTDLSLRAVARALGHTDVRAMAASRGMPNPIDVKKLIETIHSNEREEKFLFAAPPAEFAADQDPGHEFKDVLVQLCGHDHPYPTPPGWPVGGGMVSALPTRMGGPYPLINNGGFATLYKNAMQCYEHGEQPHQQLPVLLQLAREFAVCDRWFSSLPGPTWPNRFFMHAASSAGLDDSPSPASEFEAELFSGFSFHNGTIFHRIQSRHHEWAVFHGDSFPVTAALADLEDGKFFDFDEFETALNNPKYPFAYTFIEPDYGNDLPLSPEDFTCGNSQHPKDDVTRGEKLIKRVYEIIRNSPNWFKSVLLITYDEHGGFFDHVPPPPTVAPGDGLYFKNIDPLSAVFSTTPPAYVLAGTHAFDFTQLGVRVPAVVISARTARATIDHTTYDHTSLLATVEKLFDLEPLTDRDRNANSFNHLFSLELPRRDTLSSLFKPADSGLICDGDHLEKKDNATPEGNFPRKPQANSDAPMSSLMYGFVYVAFLRHYRIASQDERPALIEDFKQIKKSSEARAFMQRAIQKIKATQVLAKP